MTTPMWEIIRLAAIFPLSTFGTSLVAWKITGSTIHRTMALKVRAFVPAFTGVWLVVGYLAYGDPFRPVRVVFASAVMYGWWITRDKDEWKRRRRAATKKVAELAGRLVVNPEEIPE